MLGNKVVIKKRMVNRILLSVTERNGSLTLFSSYKKITYKERFGRIFHTYKETFAKRLR